jgi:hypothetical protein
MVKIGARIIKIRKLMIVTLRVILVSPRPLNKLVRVRWPIPTRKYSRLLIDRKKEAG